MYEVKIHVHMHTYLRVEAKTDVNDRSIQLTFQSRYSGLIAAILLEVASVHNDSCRITGVSYTVAISQRKQSTKLIQLSVTTGLFEKRHEKSVFYFIEYARMFIMLFLRSMK